MTRPRQVGLSGGFTMGELMVVVAVVIGVLVFMSSFWKKPRRRYGPSCVSNLKQIGIGFQMFANDSEEKFPEFNSTNEAWQYFQSTGDQFSSPRILLCPMDKGRLEVTRLALDFDLPATTNSFAHSSHQNNSLSYFYGVDAAKAQPKMFLAGDRNLSFNGQTITRMAKVRSESPLSWTKAGHEKTGNILFVDGSVRLLSSAELRQAISLGTNNSQRLILP